MSTRAATLTTSPLFEEVPSLGSGVVDKGLPLSFALPVDDEDFLHCLTVYQGEDTDDISTTSAMADFDFTDAFGTAFTGATGCTFLRVIVQRPAGGGLPDPAHPVPVVITAFPGLTSFVADAYTDDFNFPWEMTFRLPRFLTMDDFDAGSHFHAAVPVGNTGKLEIILQIYLHKPA